METVKAFRWRVESAKNRLKRYLVQGLGVAVVAPALFVAISVATPGVAHARCDGAGSGNYMRSTLIVNGLELVAEASDSGTCNNNGAYSGHFAAKQATWRAWVLIDRSGGWELYPGSGYNMNNNTYSYRDNNSYTRMALCADNGTTTWCGWGTTVARNTWPVFSIPSSGINYGF